jgi:hypothetical protein
MPRQEPEVIGEIADIEIIAVGRAIRELDDLRKKYGGDRWRKLKGVATVRRRDGSIIVAEVHWYECHGIGQRKMKVKRRIK